MDSGASFFQSGGRSYYSLENYWHNPKQVYLSLCCAYIAAETAAYLHHLGKIAVLLTSFACLGCLAWLFYTPSYEKRNRVGWLVSFSIVHGASLGPIIVRAMEVDPSILVNILVAAALVFACLYLGGYSFLDLPILLWLQLAFSTLVIYSLRWHCNFKYFQV